MQACVTTHFPDYVRRNSHQPFREGRVEYNGSAHTPFFEGWFSGVEEDGENWVLPTAWRALFRQHFVYIGWMWKRIEDQDASTRIGWRVQALQTSAGVYFDSQPSYHEQLEARLLLRGWLRGKVPNEQINNLTE